MSLDDALCVKHPYDPTLWDGVRDGEKAPERAKRQAQAKAICNRCPAILACRKDFDPLRDEGVRFGVVLAEIRKAPALDPALFVSRRAS